MFQLTKRVTSITLNDEERNVINERITLYQEQRGIVFSSVKELFFDLLSQANSTENKEVVKVDETQNNEIISNLNEIIDKNVETIATLHSENEQLSTENKTLKEQFEELQNSQEIEVVEVAGSFKPNETDIYIPLTGEKTEVLKAISNNRLRKGYDKELLSVSQIAEKLIFNKGTLYNWAGEIYTGLK
jgi:hypothetical protein